MAPDRAVPADCVRARADCDCVRGLAGYRDRSCCRPDRRRTAAADSAAAAAADCCTRAAPFLPAILPEAESSRLVTRVFLRPFRHRSCHSVTLEHRSSRCPVVLIRLVRDTGQHPRKAQ